MPRFEVDWIKTQGEIAHYIENGEFKGRNCLNIATNWLNTECVSQIYSADAINHCLLHEKILNDFLTPTYIFFD